jgi:hypothetical protein
MSDASTGAFKPFLGHRDRERLGRDVWQRLGVMIGGTNCINARRYNLTWAGGLNHQRKDENDTFISRLSTQLTGLAEWRDQK